MHREVKTKLAEPPAVIMPSGRKIVSTIFAKALTRVHNSIIHPTMKRGSVKASSSEMVALWVPRPLVEALDCAVHIEDTDRSKFIRRALRRRIKELGIPLPNRVEEAA
jgi:hypothetical protein